MADNPASILMFSIKKSQFSKRRLMAMQNHSGSSYLIIPLLDWQRMRDSKPIAMDFKIGRFTARKRKGRSSARVKFMNHSPVHQLGANILGGEEKKLERRRDDGALRQ